LVVATEAAPSGLEAVANWCRALGSTEIADAKTFDPEASRRLERAGIDLRSHNVFKVSVDSDHRHLGPAALFRGSEYVLLALCLSDMSEPFFPSSSLDVIVNRGSISYLDERGVRATLGLMRDALREAGQLIVTFKSTRDTRFSEGEAIEGHHRRRRIASGDQQGLEMDFFDEARLVALLGGMFEIKRLLHLEETDVMT